MIDVKMYMQRERMAKVYTLLAIAVTIIVKGSKDFAQIPPTPHMTLVFGQMIA